MNDVINEQINELINRIANGTIHVVDVEDTSDGVVAVHCETIEESDVFNFTLNIAASERAKYNV